MARRMTADQIAALPYRPCVGVMLTNGTGGVFVGQRIDRDQAAWQMPQGGIDPGESPTEAALRELGEETGLQPHHVRVEALTDSPLAYDLPLDVVPTIWGGKYRGQAQHWALMRFLGQDADVDIATAHPEFSSWKWMPKGELLSHIVPFKRQVYAQVLDLFGDRI